MVGTPHKIGAVNIASYASTQIELFHEKADGQFDLAGSGTGFFYRFGSAVALVTNWHVVTGRHPEKPGQLLEGYSQSPTHIQLHMTTTEEPTHFRPGQFFPLYRGGKPVWLEGEMGGENVDIVFLLIDFPANVHAPCVNDFAPYSRTLFTPGINFVIVGYPFPRDESNPFPIRKQAMLASEPGFLVNGRGYAFLDTPGRPGMSGSPVYFLRSGFLATSSEVENLTKATDWEEELSILVNIGPRLHEPVPRVEFAGIYSGSYETVAWNA